MAVPGLAVGAAVLLLHVAAVAPYPGGKVTESCHDMVPHHGHTPHPEPVHSVSVSQATFAPGDHLEGTCWARGCCFPFYPFPVSWIFTAAGAARFHQTRHLFGQMPGVSLTLTVFACPPPPRRQGPWYFVSSSPTPHPGQVLKYVYYQYFRLNRREKKVYLV